MLFALRGSFNNGPLKLRSVCLRPGSWVPAEALMDLAMEWFSGAGGQFSLSKGCPICGRQMQSSITTLDGVPVCKDHLPLLWEHYLKDRTGLCGDTTRCPRCHGEVSILWLKDGCTHCFWGSILQQKEVDKWIFVGGTPIALGEVSELGAYIEAWNRLQCCKRCGCRQVRIRRLSLEFPRARGPVVALWELTKGEIGRDEKVRQRQLRAFTEGLLSVTVECPQCGYQEMEYPGLDEELLNFRKILSRL